MDQINLSIFIPFMPGLQIKKSDFTAVGKCSDEEAERILFDFGIELDDIVDVNGEKEYKLDIAANRYDLLCKEGLNRAIGMYLGNEFRQEEEYETSSEIRVVQNETHERKHIACGILRGVNLDYDSFIGYQEKLHSTIGRGRVAVAIGTHDLSRIRGVVEYSSRRMSEISFKPLNGTRVVNGTELVNETGEHLQKYFGILTDPNRAVVFESDGNVLSVPPIINSDYSKIGRSTRDIFIEVTGTNFNRVNQVLILLLVNFKGTGRIERVEIQKGETKIVTPVLEKVSWSFTFDEIRVKTGLELSPERVEEFLRSMQYRYERSGRSIRVWPMHNRMDVIGKCDVIEDLLVCYGFNNVSRANPNNFYSIGREEPLNKFSDKMREEMAMVGYNEVMTLTLLSRKENVCNQRMVVVSRAKSREYEGVRTSLLPGIVKSVGSNLSARLPLRLFESSDVVVVGEKPLNRRMLAGIYAGRSSKLEEMIGTISLLFKKIPGALKFSSISGEVETNWVFDDGRMKTCFIPSQAARIHLNGRHVGYVGVVNPAVNRQFKVPYPMSAFEIDLELVYSLIEREV
ncbi:SYFB [Enterospora canceri]|uniref:phenylalanine--tRNA ligase n=1 Tax=Enterospora canceri TaxID=1081671 RepID=A0A1Y1S6T5_9MICR|nr:SYFB [Enterospora canceri]